MRLIDASRITTGLSALRQERGQVLILFVGIISVVFAIGAITVDVGYMYSERRGIARASDLSALAGVRELPESRTNAVAAVLEWARRNGYDDGVDGVEVQVRFFCGNSLRTTPDGLCSNPARPLLSNCELERGCDALEVKIRKPMQHLFSGIFGVSGTHAGFASLANVKFNVTPLDAAILLDATGSMRPEFNEGIDAMKEAQIAANNFADILLSATDALSQVGYVPLRDCFSPPRAALPPELGEPCVPASQIVDFIEDPAPLHAAINATVAGGGTNICLPFAKALEMFNGPNAQTEGNVRKRILLLSDGDNEYSGPRAFGNGQPPLECRPRDPDAHEPTGGACESSSRPAEGDLDDATFELARRIEQSLDLEIYVVGLGVCGAPNGDVRSDAYCNGIGNGGDSVADRRLLRCIASSAEGTNDHYFEVASASELPPIFQKIAFEIVDRGLAAEPGP